MHGVNVMACLTSKKQDFSQLQSLQVLYLGYVQQQPFCSSLAAASLLHMPVHGFLAHQCWWSPAGLSRRCCCSVLQIVKTSQAVSVATAAPTQPAAAVEKAAAVAAGTDQPAATAPTDSSQPAEAVQMDPNAGGLPTDGVTPGQASTPGSSTVSLDGLSIAPVYSYRKDGAGGATLERAKSVNAADTESVSMLMFVFIGLLALAL